MRSPNMYEFNL